MSMDFGKRFWISDDTDLNRLFPGNPSGESGSRVAYAIMETTRGYRYGIHLPSFYLGGTFMPHIRLLDPEHGSTSLANLFGLPYVIEAKRKLMMSLQHRQFLLFCVFLQEWVLSVIILIVDISQVF